MPATTPGIKQVELPGRKGRDGKRKKSVRYEVKAYNSATKRTEYVGRYETLSEAKDVKRRFEQAQGAGGRNRTRLTARALVEKALPDAPSHDGAGAHAHQGQHDPD